MRLVIWRNGFGESGFGKSGFSESGMNQLTDANTHNVVLCRPL